MPGYSGTPLSKKLGIEPGYEVHLAGAPAGYRRLLDPLPNGVRFVARLSDSTDLIHLFSDRQSHLEEAIDSIRAAMKPTAILWVSWPKKASKVPTDVTEDVVRAIALPLGLVDTKVCAVDEIWSGLKLVARKRER